jgi:amino acid transporter
MVGKKSPSVSNATLNRWWLVLLLSVTGIAILFSSVYFLYFPNGFQGGRNLDYETTILFGREMWDTIHLWAGIGMIVVLVIHIAVHDKWISVMAKRLFRGKSNGINRLNGPARLNILLDTIAALSFIAAAITGFVLMFYPSGRNIPNTINFIFTKEVWDLIHTWSGVIMLISAVLHFYIHWKWITKVTNRVIGSINNVNNYKKILRSTND